MFRAVIIAGLIFSAAQMPGHAQEFTAEQLVEKPVVTRTDPDGSVEVKFVKAERVQPGETLLYSLNYNNGTTDRIENARLVMAVPEEVTYNENSAKSDLASVSFSTDGGTSFAPRGQLRVSSDGVTRSATSEDITHIQWSFTGTIAPGETGQLTYSAVVR